MRQILLSSLLVFGLAACATEPIPEATTLEPEQFRTELPNPQPITMRDIDWRIIQTNDGPMFAITPKDYEDLALNMNEILRWMREVKAIKDGR